MQVGYLRVIYLKNILFITGGQIDNGLSRNSFENEKRNRQVDTKMFMNQGMALEQRQALHLTVQMRQSIEILQMNTIDLSQWLQKESQENPVLEIEMNPVTAKDREKNQDGVSAGEDLPKMISHEEMDREEVDSFFSYRRDRSVPVKTNRMTTEQDADLQNLISQNMTLQEHLLLSFNVTAKTEIDFKIGEYLICNINRNGYLGISCLEAARDLGIPEKRVRQVLAMIQNCSNPGLGARNLKECLLLQLKYLKLEEKPFIKRLIISFLDELSQKNFKVICKAMNLSFFEVQNLLDIIIRNFDPKPGRIFYQKNEIHFAIPDIIVKKGDAKYEIIENTGYLPSIRINSFYSHLLSESKISQELKIRDSVSEEKEKEYEKTLEYLKKKIKSARWIMRCVEQRRRTLLDITRLIIDYQSDFLDNGVTYLKPLSLKKVADLLHLHESTISRTINGKRVQLPRGTYEMKYFFSKGIPQEKNEVVSNERIKSLIKNYIEKENPYFPYSDQQLAELLQQRENLHVARRTVTKYRRLLGLSSARMRRRY